MPALDVIVVAPAKLAVSGLDGVYARVTVAGQANDGRIYSAIGDTAWEAVARAIASYYRRAILRERVNLADSGIPEYPPRVARAPADDEWGADPFPPPGEIARAREPIVGRERDAEVDPLLRAVADLPLWGGR